MKQRIEDALRRLEAKANTMVAKDDVAIVRAALMGAEGEYDRGYEHGAEDNCGGARRKKKVPANEPKDQIEGD